MFNAIYECGSGVQQYVDEALSAFDEDRTDYLIEREEELYGEDAAQKMEAFVEHLEREGVPPVEDVASKRPFAIFYLAHHGAQLILKAAGELTYPYPDQQTESRIDWQALLNTLQDGEIAGEVDEAMQLAIAEELFTDLGGKAARCRDLALRILAERPNPHVMQYVARLTRCYIAGFLPECVILCRAVVDNAVRDQFRRYRVPIPANQAGKSEMKTMLDWSVRVEWLSRNAASAAEVVWKRGSKAVHEDIGATKDVLGTIQLTLDVLTEIYGAA